MVTSVRRLDHAIYDRNGQLRVGVIAKNLSGKPASWASEYYRNLLEYDALPELEYFLLVLADTFYLWHRQDHAHHNGSFSPNYSGDATPVLAPYAERISFKLADLSKESFEWLVEGWLNDLVKASPTLESASSPLEWVVTSGLHEAIRNGRVAAELML